MFDLSSSNMILENMHRDEFEISAIVINLFSSANKISEAMVKAVKDLSTREYEILVDLVHDYKYSEIASKRHIDLETVKSHVSHIYSKLGVQCKAMAKLVYFAHLSATSG